jgi:hypothetical protein
MAAAHFDSRGRLVPRDEDAGALGQAAGLPEREVSAPSVVAGAAAFGDAASYHSLLAKKSSPRRRRRRISWTPHSFHATAGWAFPTPAE